MMFKQQAMMAEVTRLTRAGDLGEAMALLRGRRPPDAVPPPAPMAALPKGAAQAPGPLAGSATALLNRFGAARLRGASPASVTGRAAMEAPAPGSFDRRAFSNRAGSRAYRLYEPRGRAGEALPLVVMLHGCQQSPEDFAAGTRMNALAEEKGFRVAYPEQSAAANQSRCWNWFVPGDQSRDGGEPALIAGITRQVMGEASVDPSRVFIAGLSAGGAAAAIMASTHPDLYAAVCVHSGLACGAARDMSSAFSAMQGGGAVPAGLPDHPRRAIVFHGDRDHTVNMVNGDQVIAQAKGAGSYNGAVTRGRSSGGMDYTRTVHADAEGKPVLEHWVLHGLGHAWSGGSAAGSFTDPRGPDASREMMRFFLDA